LSAGTQAHHRISAEDIKTIWKKAAGSLASRRSRPTSLKKGKLVVAVGDSSLLYDLTLRKREILASLTKETEGRIQEVGFRIGETSGEKKSQGTKKRKNERTEGRK
jgi:hypothetical protein